MKTVIRIILAVALSSIFAVRTASALGNLLVNPGFETGDFTGWTVGGNSIQTGVATYGTLIPNSDPPFTPCYQNVHSGNFAGNALVKDYLDPAESILLTQTVAVAVNQNVDVGFWVGNYSQSTFGMNIDDSHTQIFINGNGILPAELENVYPGSGSGDFILVSGSFNTGAQTSITVAFQINGSGTSRVGVSFDDFYFTPVAVPEPTSLPIAALGVGALMIFRRRK